MFRVVLSKHIAHERWTDIPLLYATGLWQLQLIKRWIPQQSDNNLPLLTAFSRLFAETSAITSCLVQDGHVMYSRNLATLAFVDSENRRRNVFWWANKKAGSLWLSAQCCTFQSSITLLIISVAYNCFLRWSLKLALTSSQKLFSEYQVGESVRP